MTTAKHTTTVERVAHQSYTVKCACGYERFTTGNRARVSARNIASDHKRQVQSEPTATR